MRKLLVISLVLLVMAFTAVPALAHTSGCTPGFWKNNTSAAVWGPTGYTTSQTLDNVFVATGGVHINWGSIGIPASTTLLEALNFQGGPGLNGAAQILLRAAVAALLNGAHPSVDGFDAAWVIEHTVLYLNGVEGQPGLTQRGSILYLAALFDGENNIGCPIDAHGNVI